MNPETQEQASNTVDVQIGDKILSLDPVLLAQYKGEAMDILRTEANAKEQAKEQLTEVLDAMASTFNVEKGLLKKWIKASFKDEVEEKRKEADAITALDDLVHEATA